ncbi:MAG: aminopeptidase [Candidatus Bathyarchaeota archaeon]|nr:MAG: aminopeptidase [Candidatus Bathyarchaeota archaeon]
MEATEAARNALDCVLETVSGERVLVICDDEKLAIGTAFGEGAVNLDAWIRLITLKTSEAPRSEVPRQLIEVLSSQKPDVYVNLLRGRGDETPFRLKLIHLETREKRARLGHCPGVTLRMLTHGALALTINEHRTMQESAGELMKVLNGTSKIMVKSALGTDLSLSVQDRVFFTDTILDWAKMKWMNLPTGEVIVAPREDSLEGKLVCDSAVGGLDSLKHPAELTVEKGVVKAVHSDDKEALTKINQFLQVDEDAGIVGEFAFGINPKARLSTNFLEAEKTLGTIHIAFGHNTDMPGGRNPSKTHTDFLMTNPIVTIVTRNGNDMTVLSDGKFRI